MQQSSKHVIVGMSGGVDSSVAALLLKEEGCQVEGLFMKNWEDQAGDGPCSADQDYVDAKTVATQLGIPLHVANFSQKYWDQVFTQFLAEYKAGRTPNPDVWCNREIKFKAFLSYALEDLGADLIATGHYARSRCLEQRFQLLKGVDPEKDQSYFLYLLNQDQLSKILFPIGNFTKKQTRELAQIHGFRNSDKKGSTGICFIGEKNFRQFLSHYLTPEPGNIETLEGKVIGRHEGLMYYTIGQRQGLGIGGKKGCIEAPWYVLKKDIARRALIVVQGDHPMLYTQQLQAQTLHWIDAPPSEFPFHCASKIRYRQTDQACCIESIDQGTAQVTFEKPQRAVAPGQSIVFYQGDVCLGGGIM